MRITDKIEITNECNMELMARYPDNYFDLAIVDPPYGINVNKSIGFRKQQNKLHKDKNWDNEIPPTEYWKELFRVSKNQIVWGGNYFIENLKNTRCFIVWDKMNGSNSMADCELAWTSFNSSVRLYARHIFTGIGNTNYKTIHPTQKPAALYKYCLENYANPDFKILDTHLGSGSIAIACHDYGFELTACELDKDYYDAAVKRIKNHVGQTKLF